MSEKTGILVSLRRRLGNGDIFFIVLTTISMATVLIQRDPISRWRLVSFLLIGVTYCLLGIWRSGGDYLAIRFPAGYFTIQTILALSIILLGDGDGIVGLVTGPLASHAIFFMPARRGYYFGLFLIATLGPVYAVLGVRDPLDLLTTVAAFGAGIGFAMITSYWYVQEFRARAEVERLNRALTLANQKLRELASQSAELAAAQERNRIARELHDSLGHHLTTVSIQLDVAGQLIPVDPEKAQTLVQKAGSLTRQGLQDVRQSVAALRTDPVIDRPLPDAVQALVEEAAQAGLTVGLKVAGEPQKLNYQTHLTLYRAAQEALTNLHKHAQASRAEVSLEYGEACIRLAVENDGPPDASGGQQTGFGLVGLRERVALLGGALDAGPRAEGGFRFVVQVPAP